MQAEDLADLTPDVVDPTLQERVDEMLAASMQAEEVVDPFPDSDMIVEITELLRQTEDVVKIKKDDFIEQANNIIESKAPVQALRLLRCCPVPLPNLLYSQLLGVVVTESGKVGRSKVGRRLLLFVLRARLGGDSPILNPLPLRQLGWLLDAITLPVVLYDMAKDSRLAEKNEEERSEILGTFIQAWNKLNNTPIAPEALITRWTSTAEGQSVLEFIRKWYFDDVNAPV
jgi:hypothetical protein